MSDILMPKATAVWLLDNTSLTFNQIAAFCGLHYLEVKGIADGDVAENMRGVDPIAGGMLSREEIRRGEEDDGYTLKKAASKIAHIPQPKRKGSRYTPVIRRQDKPDAVAWFIRNHPEVSDAQISKLIGTTKSTINNVRDKSHWNSANIRPVDPVTLGLCTQINLDLEVEKASRGIVRPEEIAEEERLLSASQTQNWDRSRENREEGELDAAAVFAKLSSMQSTDTDEDDGNQN